MYQPNTGKTLPALGLDLNLCDPAWCLRIENEQNCTDI